MSHTVQSLISLQFAHSSSRWILFTERSYSTELARQLARKHP